LILLWILVHVSMLAGVLTLTHCVIYSHSEDMHPYDAAAIPKDLRGNVSEAGTNALICFSKRAGVENFNKFLAHELHDMGGIRMHRWGFAFSSAISPLVPICLGLVNYWILWDRSTISWDFLTVLAVDILDCIVMFDTMFAHDPYFLFEDLDHAFMWTFVLVLYILWNIATFQLIMEKGSARSSGQRFSANTMPGLTSWLLNVAFLGLRGVLRAKAMYCTPIFLLKNMYFLVDIPLEVIKKRGEKTGVAEGVHPLLVHDPNVSGIEQVRRQMNLLKVMILNFKQSTTWGNTPVLGERARPQFKKARETIDDLWRKHDGDVKDEVAKGPTRLDGNKIAASQSLLKVLEEVGRELKAVAAYFESVDGMVDCCSREAYKIPDVDLYFGSIEDTLVRIRDDPSKA